MSFAPVVLFVYNRINHTHKTVLSLSKNEHACDTDLIIFSDDARSKDNKESVDEVRAYLNTISGFRSIHIYYRPYNFGLAKSIIEGVSQVLKTYNRIIVLEDDLVTSPYFLTYMNQALNKYENDDRVASIHGYVYPIKSALPETFFLRGADCWGWATWRRGWKVFNPNGQFLLDELKKQDLINEFNFNGVYSFSNMLERQIKGVNDSWAVRWHASAFLANKLTLYPARSLVHNIGVDGSGVHCDKSNTYDVFLSSTPIRLDDIEVMPSIEGTKAFKSFLGQYKITFTQRVRILLMRII